MTRKPLTIDQMRDNRGVPKPLVTNADRAEWALAAVQEFQRLTGSDNEDAISDLICDLMHLAAGWHQDPKEQLARAVRHYYAETHNEKLPSYVEIVVED